MVEAAADTLGAVRLGLSMGYVVGSGVHDYVELAREADRLGYSVAWAAEAYGSGAPSVLSYVAACTQRIDVGAAVMQTPYLAAIGPKNLELTGEIADGWLAIFFSPEYADEALSSIATGRERAERTSTAFDVAASVPVVIGDDLKTCAEPVRNYAALYLGGMGSRERNFYNQLACRMGFQAGAKQVQDLFLDRKHRAAAAAVPLEFIDQTSLLGPHDRIVERFQAFAGAGVTTLNVVLFGADLTARAQTLRQVCEAFATSGLAD